MRCSRCPRTAAPSNLSAACAPACLQGLHEDSLETLAMLRASAELRLAAGAYVCAGGLFNMAGGWGPVPCAQRVGGHAIAAAPRGAWRLFSTLFSPTLPLQSSKLPSLGDCRGLSRRAHHAPPPSPPPPTTSQQAPP